MLSGKEEQRERERGRERGREREMLPAAGSTRSQKKSGTA